jgi:uncharacterized membrane protein YphA (DoxX/SURF4 family)
VLLLRLALGAYFIGHGVAKLQSMDSTVAMFNTWGFATFWAYAVSIAEVVAGIAFILGAFLWLAAALIVVEMAVAIYSVIGPNPQGEPALFHFIFGWGPNVIYAMAALCLAFVGAGKWSLTGWWLRRRGAQCMQCKADHGLQCECKKDDSGGHHPDCSCAACGCGK